MIELAWPWAAVLISFCVMLAVVAWRSPGDAAYAAFVALIAGCVVLD